MTTGNDDLEPIDPRTARELFLKHKGSDCADATVRNYTYHTKSFVEWCEDQESDNLNDITGRHLQRFKIWREDEFDLTRMTVKNHVSSLRVFLKWAANHRRSLMRREPTSSRRRKPRTRTRMG